MNGTGETESFLSQNLFSLTFRNAFGLLTVCGGGGAIPPSLPLFFRHWFTITV